MMVYQVCKKEIREIFRRESENITINLLPQNKEKEEAEEHAIEVLLTQFLSQKAVVYLVGQGR